MYHFSYKIKYIQFNDKPIKSFLRFISNPEYKVAGLTDVILNILKILNNVILILPIVLRTRRIRTTSAIFLLFTQVGRLE